MKRTEVSEPSAIVGELKGKPMSSRAQRFVTGAVAVPIALGIIFFMPAPVILVAAVIIFGGAAVEYVRLVRHWAPSAPLGIVPAAAIGIALALDFFERSGHAPQSTMGLVVLLITAGSSVLLLSGLLTLMSPTRMPEAMIGTGLIHFGIPYFALPMISIHILAVRDPWILTLLLVAIWAGDTFAYLCGGRFGRRKFAPVVSPNKTWERRVGGSRRQRRRRVAVVGGLPQHHRPRPGRHRRGGCHRRTARRSLGIDDQTRRRRQGFVESVAGPWWPLRSLGCASARRTRVRGRSVADRRAGLKAANEP